MRMVRSGSVWGVALLMFGGASSLLGQGDEVKRVFDFSRTAAEEWVPVNDDVMGGVSSSRFRQSAEGFATFEGTMSLENNGGFASARGVVDEGTLAGASRMVLRVRGDGQRYQLRLRMGSRFDGIAYAAEFETVRGEWTTVSIPLRSFEPTFRGFRPRNAPPLDAGDVRQIGIMLTDKQDGPFRIDVEWIGAGLD